jgi:Tol biopolymer transport system component
VKALHHAAMLAALAAIALIVAAGGTARTTDAAFPGFNGLIAFANYHAPDQHIWLMNAQGLNRKQLTNGSGTDYQPVWSPKGGMLAFRRNDASSGMNGLYVIDANGSNEHMIPGTEDGYTASWAPDGQKIAFTLSPVGSDDDIAVIKTDGGGFINLTGSVPGNQYSPAWSPDGTKIAYMQESPTGGIDLYVMDSNGNNPVPITNTPGFDKDDPDWSPDGSHIVFVSEAGVPVNKEIFTVKANGDDPTNVSNYPTTDDFDPAYSPDGLRIVYAGSPVLAPAAVPQGTNASDIVVMDADGQNKNDISLGQGPDYAPDWGVDALHLTWGNNDCVGGTTALDALPTLLHEAGFAAPAAGVAATTGGCPNVGETLHTASFGDRIWGDLDCSGHFDAPDVLLILRYAADLPLANLQDCPALGIAVALAPI